MLKDYNFFVIYFLVINVVAFLAFAIDKINAAARKNRVRNIALLGLAFFGGSIGALSAMYTLRHKTRKGYYYIGIPLMIIVQVAVGLVFLYS